MGIFSKESPEKPFSPQSQQSALQVQRFRVSVEHIDGALLWEKKYLDNAESALRSHLHQGGDGMVITGASSEIARRRETVKIMEDERRALLEKIDSIVNPYGQAAAERKRQQESLAAIAAKRLEHDAKIAATVQRLVIDLRARAAMTAQMAEIGAGIGFTFQSDGLDQGRFDALEKALPPDIVERGKAWLAWFLGKPRGERKQYVVREKEFTLPETLCSPNAYRQGDTIGLSAEEYSGLKPEARRCIAPASPLAASA